VSDVVPAPPQSRRILYGYFTLSGLYTLSAALIWGVNTLFLLSAGLSFLEVFIANAAFSAGMVVFEIPTGVVADTLGRRVSFLLSVSVLGVTTLMYVGLAQLEAGVVAFSLVSVLMGLGFTFYSGAMEAWLVDALNATGYRGLLDRVFARGQQITGAAMLVGTVGGGLLGQVDLSIPYVVRAVLLAAVFVVAYVVMHDVGFTPRRVTPGELPGEVARNARAGVEFGWRQRSLRLLMVAGAIQSGFLIWGFYASQPYLLELLDSDAVWIAGFVAAGVALATIVGNQIVRFASRHCGRRTTLLLAVLGGIPGAARRHGRDWRDRPGPFGVSPSGRAERAARDRRVVRLHALERRRDRRPGRTRGARGGALDCIGVRRRGARDGRRASAPRQAAPPGRRSRRHRGRACGRREPVRRIGDPGGVLGRDALPGGGGRRGRRLARLTRETARLEHVPATVIVGAQWGDEGKGKIVDLLAQDSDLVCRYQGGPNAGHTVVVGDETYKIRQIPTGIIAGKRCAIGASCVVDPGVLISELDDLESREHETLGLLFVSGNAHLVMPWHVALDGARERRLGRLQIGTTRRGIGPAYADKATRIGIRVQDLLDSKILRQKLELAVTEKNVWLERVYELEPFDVEDVVSMHLGFAERLAPYVADTSLLVDRTLRAGDRVLFEGAQGTLLDLDHGTYPFVTSSSPIAAGAAVSFGIGPNRIEEVLGVAKAYVTRVGEGPFPSEIVGPDHERVQTLGHEFGTVTGRERRCGWLDLVALRFAVRVNGITSLALTKLDVLSSFPQLPVCVRYRLPDGSETEDFPAHQSDFHHCRPVFEVLDGWEASIEDELPDAARAYVGFVSDALGVPVTLVGTGAAREHVLALG
jgi:adenylosuccinate synthase